MNFNVCFDHLREPPVKYISNNALWLVFTKDGVITDVTYNNHSINLTPKRESIIINFLKSINKW